MKKEINYRACGFIRRCNLISIATLVSFGLLSQSAFAQFAQPQKGPRKIENFGSVQLLAPPDLPYFPPYAGRIKYTTIFSNNNPNVPNGISYGMIFNTTDTPETVIDFYRDVAKQYQWQPYNSSSDKSVSAGRKGYAFYVTIMRGAVPGYKSQVYINYSILSGAS